MTDREKVITGLECCENGAVCPDCPYHGEPWECTADLARDALALLKEQEVEPKSDYPDSRCPECGAEFVEELAYYLGHPIKEYYRHCPGCGRRVKWDADGA